MPLPTDNEGAERGSPCSRKGIPTVTLRGHFLPSHRAHPRSRRGVTAVGDSRGAHRGGEQRRDGAGRGTALRAVPPRISAGRLGTAPLGQPHPPHNRRCPGQPRSAPRSAHLPPRQCRATARGAACKLSSSPGLRAVRCGAVRSAPRPSSAPGAPQLRRRAAAGREGAPGPLPFPRAARRPPPNPAGRRAGTGRGGAVRGGQRGGRGGLGAAPAAPSSGVGSRL